MANNTSNIRAALQTISQASTESLVPHIWKLCEANAAIAKAFLSLSRKFCEETGQLETPAKDLATLEDTDLASSQAQSPTILRDNTWQDVSQGTLQQYNSRRGRPENAIVRLAQYWVQRRLAGTSVLNVADEQGVLDDIRKAVISSTPVFLALVRGIKKRRSAINSRR
ncbi:uncharacterized protein SETTUDRAFT_39942 [Exserohilum turcica Et28A]|uniref:Uncharacterized protein n=1 Tax=Exserohilum turcicum (strain 28A) TaxID=671987 RepID=R0ILI0_EXST2|nr:uncharacterized protein SETTUDRAFT_39942 [Exserohilum turcica Et28A]EOA85925.1 hypothetical protein SETTUDRAFT_39942 [Exserohilum turcica Et28A]